MSWLKTKILFHQIKFCRNLRLYFQNCSRGDLFEISVYKNASLKLFDRIFDNIKGTLILKGTGFLEGLISKFTSFAANATIHRLEPDLLQLEFTHPTTIITNAPNPPLFLGLAQGSYRIKLPTMMMTLDILRNGVVLLVCSLRYLFIQLSLYLIQLLYFLKSAHEIHALFILSLKFGCV